MLWPCYTIVSTCCDHVIQSSLHVVTLWHRLYMLWQCYQSSLHVVTMYTISLHRVNVHTIVSTYCFTINLYNIITLFYKSSLHVVTMLYNPCIYMSLHVWQCYTIVTTCCDNVKQSSLHVVTMLYNLHMLWQCYLYMLWPCYVYMYNVIQSSLHIMPMLT